jgi:hypothetical protein
MFGADCSALIGALPLSGGLCVCGWRCRAALRLALSIGAAAGVWILAGSVGADEPQDAGGALLTPDAAASGPLPGASLMPASSAQVPPSHPAPRVEITVAGNANEAGALETTIRGALGPSAVFPGFRGAPSIDPRDILTPPSRPSSAIARVWLDLQPGHVTVYIVDQPWERVLVRHIRSSGPIDPVAREEVAQVVTNAIEAMLAGGRIGVSREQAARSLTPLSPEPRRQQPAPRPSVAPLPKAVPSSEAARLWSMWLGYETMAWAAGPVFVHGPCAASALTWGAVSTSPEISLALHYRVPVVADGPPVGVRLDTFAIRSTASLAIWRSSTLQLRFGATTGVEFVHVEPQFAGDERLQLDSSRMMLVPTSGAWSGFGWRVWAHVTLHLRLGVDVDMKDTRFVVHRADREQTVLDPWRWRPFLQVWVGSFLL